jgi:hypothetical protein
MSLVHSPIFSDSISEDRHTNQLRQKKNWANFKYHFRPNRRGRFFRAKAEKKSAPDGSAKRDFNWQACRQQQKCQPQPMDRSKRD